ncbi:MAG: tannase/feruloyl esterase family alpha/beta hydrolase [Deltaproteobacteria bacterium]|nr:tannase/feruloyl esterase family alpha/beta hydrolase [Deltaproteobacteria bacterium]
MEKRKDQNLRLFFLLSKITIILMCLFISACEKDSPERNQSTEQAADAIAGNQASDEAVFTAVDYTKADILPVKACESMSSFKADDLIQLGSDKISAEGGTPGFCKVRGMLSPEIAFEVNLPDKWNGRFYMIGNGGHAGQALDDPMQVPQIKEAIAKGFAIALTNTGHDTQKEPGASFVMSNPQKAIDYAYRAVHLTAVTSKAITADYYQQPVKYSYWNSCSNGGRQGLIEAQRYPEDFDGIIANAPWLDQTGFTIGAMWNQKALSEVTLSAEKMAMVAESVMEKCDAIDGLKDGLIDDPRKCAFDPAKDVPACKDGADNPDCLTAAQANAIAKVYQGPISNGKNIFPGFMPGSEAVMQGWGGGPPVSGWMGLIVSTQPGFPSADFGLAQDTMRYLVHNPPKPDYDCMTFDFDKDIHMLDAWSKIADAKNPDLSGFRKKHGKLLMTYGWSDPVLQPMMGVNYYEEAIKVNGPDTTDFFRLFMVPGMSHCSGGECPNQFDSVTAIVNWVEKERAPEKMIAKQIKDGNVVRSRPLCPYPEVARYKGTGSIDDAVNFECVITER